MLATLVQSVQGQNRAGVIRLDFQHPTEGRNRLRLRLHLFFVDTSDPQQHLDLLQHVLHLDHFGFVQLSQRRPGLGAIGQALQVLERLFVLWIQTQGSAEGLKGIHTALQLALVVTGDAVKQLDLAQRVLGVRHHHFQHVDELFPLTGSLEDRLQDLSGQHWLLCAVDDTVQRAQRRLVRAL